MIRNLDRSRTSTSPEEVDAAQLIGWQVPEQTTIRVALRGLKDADWTLDPDELKF